MSNEWVFCVQAWQESVYFPEKTEKPISDMFAVCGVGSVVGACSFHCMQIMLGLQLAGFLHSFFLRVYFNKIKITKPLLSPQGMDQGNAAPGYIPG